MALTLVEGSGPTWRYHQRYLLTGLDEVAALRLSLNGVPTNLAVVSDRQGSFLMAVDAAGAEEPAAGFYLTGPFGQLEPGSAAATDGGTHAGLGFTGAGTATPSGGYVYLRNRWYDPRTGRFLSQDPIGLAGGVNLYAYAGNNPIAYSDPFGLAPGPDCSRFKSVALAVCLAVEMVGEITNNVERAHGRVPVPGPEIQAPGSSQRINTTINTGYRWTDGDEPPRRGQARSLFNRGANASTKAAEKAAVRRAAVRALGLVARGTVYLGVVVGMILPDQEIQGANQCKVEQCVSRLDPNQSTGSPGGVIESSD